MNDAGEWTTEGWWIDVPTTNGSVQLGYRLPEHTYFAVQFDQHGRYVPESGIGGGWGEISTVDELHAAMRATRTPLDLSTRPDLSAALRSAREAARTAQ